MAAIYSHYVLRTTATFATSLRTPAQWRQRWRDKAESGHTMLVAELDGQVAGYVETGQFRPHDAYLHSVETSIYVAPDQGGRGVGGTLYGALFEQLDAEASLHRAFAVIALPNDPSETIHRRFGFTRRGVLTQAGRKFERWIDVAFWERPIGPGPTNGSPP